MNAAADRRWPRLITAVITGALLAALVRLAIAFLRSDLQWRYVAEHSRRDAPWYYRLAGVWGGSEGSLLLFASIVGVLAVVASQRCTRLTPLWGAAATTTVLAAICAAFANPFRSLDVPAVRGFGLTPILEHPAMAVHPPLLYVGLACTLPVAMATLDGRASLGWQRWSLALVTLAMALGAMWSYVEQGWGGYWAWDPVENTSLIVWLAVVILLHGRWGGPVGVLVGCSPWLLTLAGAAFVRSGATPSVHSFAEQPSIGWSLLMLLILTIAAVGWAATHTDAGASSTERANLVIVGAVLLLVIAGTAAPLVIEMAGGQPAAIRGVFFSRTVGPLSLAAVPFITIAAVRHRNARLAHIGMVVLALGIAASTFDREETISIADGEEGRAAGLSVRGGPVTVEPGSRPDLDAVVADVWVAGHRLRPALVAYPERGGVLAETAVVTRPWRDIQVTLIDATDQNQALIAVRQRPLMWLVWIGALLVALGALAPSFSLLRQQFVHRRRRA